MSRPLRAVMFALALIGSVAACASTGTSATSSAPAATQAVQTPVGTSLSPGPVTSAPAPATSASAAASPAPATSAPATTVSANDATHEQLVAALEAAGVPNADKWAREIEEYRPYDTSDPTLASLQQNLAKYQPSAATLAGILSVLKP